MPYNIYNDITVAEKGNQLLEKERKDYFKKYFKERRKTIKRLTIEMPNEVKEKLYLITEKEGITITQWIVKQIENYKI